jgi:hypothetical protein
MIEFDIGTKYQAVIFGSFADISPTPDVISKFLNVFTDKGLIPGTFQEIAPLIPTPQLRLRMMSPNNEWGINIGSQRVDVSKNPTDIHGSNLGDIVHFCSTATDFFSRIMSEFSKTANRVSLITIGMLKEMTHQKLDRLYIKLFNPLPFYATHHTFEWDNRSTARVPIDLDGTREDVNAITMIKRLQGMFTQGLFMDMQTQGTLLEFDRIELHIDINSLPQNHAFRFNAQAVAHFYSAVTKVRTELLDQLEELINNV